MNKITTLLSLIIITSFVTKSYSQNFNGFWQSEGYGFIFDITTNNVDAYDYTSISMIFEDWYDLDDNQYGTGDEYMGDFSLVEDQLLLTTTGGTLIYFNSIDSLPVITPNSNDPQLNFDIFWQTYHEWTSIFDANNVNWQLLYNQYSALIDVNTTDSELFGYMQSLLEELNDGHSYIDDGMGNEFSGGPNISILWDGLEYEMMDLIEENYIVGGNYQVAGNGQITYGMLNDSVGYIAVNSFDDFDPNGNELEDNLVFTNAIDMALLFLQNAQSLILDVRFNYGGYDSNSRILANRFADSVIPVYSKQVRNGDYNSFEDLIPFSIEPQGNQFLDKPVVVLTSSATLSAADVFAMAAKEIHCVTLIGETTYGIFSDSYTKYLPNGWDFGISPERYLDVNGENWEQQGITPDIEVIGSLDDFNNDEDNILSYALNNISTLCTTIDIQDVDLNERIKIFPNPSTTTISVQIENVKASPIIWEIKSMDGKLINSGISEDSNFEISNYKTAVGIYLLNISWDNKRIIRKILIN